MKKAKVLFIILPLMIFSACGQLTSEELTYYNEEPNYIKTDALFLEERYAPSDFVCVGDKIIATDSKNDCLLIINKDFEKIETIGKTGNGDNEYIDPHGIQCFDDKFYVMDSGNSRIKIIDSNFKYIDEINLKEIVFSDPSSFFDDLAIDDNGNIFFTVNAKFCKDDGKLYCIENTSNEIKVLMNNCTGIVSAYNNKIYFTNTVEYIKNRSASGNHYIYEIENCELMSLYHLPNHYTPVGIYVDDSGVYCSSMGYSEISKTNIEERQVTTLFSEQPNFDDDEDKEYAVMSVDNEIIYLLENVSKVIYKLEQR